MNKFAVLKDAQERCDRAMQALARHRGTIEGVCPRALSEAITQIEGVKLRLWQLDQKGVD